MDAAEQGRRCGLGGKVESLPGEAVLDEGVDGMRLAVLRQRGLHRSLEGPVIALVLDRDTRFIGKVRALIDPCTEDADLFVAERIALLRHAAFGTESGNEVDQGRLRAVPFLKRRAQRAIGEEGWLVIEPEIGLLMFGTVAVVAGPREDGLDVLHEVDLAIRCGRQFGEIGLGQFERRGVADNEPFRPRRARIDPGAEFADLFRLQGLRFLRRHRLVGVEAGDAMDEIGLGAFSIGEGSAVFPALAEMLGGVEPEPALLLTRPVAGDAGVLENWPDVALEIESFRRGREIGGL